jgi:dihydrolipoamide dehydrogenase
MLSKVCKTQTLFVYQRCAFAVKRTHKKNNEYDVAIIGAGAGGYIAAIRAAQKGLKTVCIDDRPALGGVCVNEGCMPSKAMLNYTQQYRDAKLNFKRLGIETNGDISVNFSVMQQAKLDTIKNLTDTISDKFYDQRITHLQGWGSFKSMNQIEVKLANGGRETITANHIIIATGSKANGLPKK